MKRLWSSGITCTSLFACDLSYFAHLSDKQVCRKKLAAKTTLAVGSIVYLVRLLDEGDVGNGLGGGDGHKFSLPRCANDFIVL